MTGQLPLGIALRDDASLENYLPGENAQLLAELTRLVAEPRAASLYIWGAPGNGRTHLLQGVCHAAAERGRPSVYLPLAQAASLDPGMLAGLEALEFLCIDDLDAVCGDAAWEEALFHLFNRVAAAGGAWVAAADRSPGTLPVRLADLGSRLAWGTSYRLKPLDDEARAQLLVERAARRGLRINPETADYLIRRSPRETGETLALLDRLDRASLAAKRRITIPFAREVLGWD